MLLITKSLDFNLVEESLPWLSFTLLTKISFLVIIFVLMVVYQPEGLINNPTVVYQPLRCLSAFFRCEAHVRNYSFFLNFFFKKKTSFPFRLFAILTLYNKSCTKLLILVLYLLLIWYLLVLCKPWILVLCKMYRICKERTQ